MCSKLCEFVWWALWHFFCDPLAYLPVFVLAADLQIKHRVGIWIIRWREQVKNRCCCTLPQRHGERNEKPNYWFQFDPWKLEMWDNSWFQRIRGCAPWLQDEGLVLHISFILCPQFSNSIFTFRPHSFSLQWLQRTTLEYSNCFFVAMEKVMCWLFYTNNQLFNCLQISNHRAQPLC